MRGFILAVVVSMLLTLAGQDIAAARQDGAAAATPAAGPANELCEMEFNDGTYDIGSGSESEEPTNPEAGIVVVPPGAAGIVTPGLASELRLYPIVITLPPGACVPYHEIAGALVLFVQEGTIHYIVHSEEENAPGVTAGQMNVDYAMRTEVKSGAPLPLGPGGWVAMDRQLPFSYRNLSSEDAVITMAALVDPAGPDGADGGVGGCNGGCRKH